ncbi:MAG: hypothetical protein LBK83_08650 [Treponema sp.]|jgi:hypothetical protein|nr:hypothetical protein [Treponema sp.]
MDINNGIQFANFVIGIVDRFQTTKLTRQNRLRACYLETLNNLALIETIDEAALKKADVFTPAFIAVVNALEIQSTVLVLFSSEEGKNTDVYGFLDKKGKIPLEEFNEKTQKDIKNLKYENITDALFFIVTGIAVLQKLCAAPPETKDMIRNLRLQVRIKNIKERSWLVRKILKEMI